MTAYGGELAPAGPQPDKGFAAVATDVTDEVIIGAGQLLTPAEEERESSSFTEGSFSLLGENMRVCLNLGYLSSILGNFYVKIV